MLWVLLLHIIHKAESACSGLPSKPSELKINVTSNDKSWVVKCSESNWVFVNNVRLEYTQIWGCT